MDFLRQPHTNDVLGLTTAFDQAPYAPNNQATNGLASGSRGEANSGAEPGQRKADAELAFKAAVPEKMGVDGTVGHGKVQLGREQVFKIFPDLCRVDGVVFHDCNPEKGGDPSHTLRASS